MPQQQPETLAQKINFAANLTGFISRIISLPSEMMLHEDVGEKRVGFAGGFALLLLLAFPLAFRECDPTPLLLFTFAFVARCIIHRFASLWKWWKGGPRNHTRRPGRPLLMRLLRTWPQSWVVWLEPFLVFALGIGVSYFARPLGTYLIFAGFGLLMTLWMSHVYHTNRLSDMNDAALEQQAMAEQFRDLQSR